MVAPAGVNGEGMPVGVQFIGAPYEDERLIGVAEIFEELRGDAWPSETLSPSTTNSSTSPTA
jgi:Asp-tRNA(Asn)/Glu-tRNA(Gln) amidotransferase A subunit family amidase